MLMTPLALSVDAAPPPSARDAQDSLLPGAKLLHKFSQQVYRIPDLHATEKGPRLLVWIDASDPTPPRRFPHEPLPDPKFDLLFWDVPENKELHKAPFAGYAAPQSPVAPSMSSPGVSIPFGSLAFTPDGKKLAYASTTHRVVPGKPVHEATTLIKFYDPDKRKSEPAIATEFKDHPRPQFLFAPDGALVILKEKTVTIQEPGKTKPRATFELVRASTYKTDQTPNLIRDAVVSPDGSLLVVAPDGMVTAYDVSAGKKHFQASRAVPEAKTTFDQQVSQTFLAFAPSPGEQKLLAVESVTGPPKHFVLARVFDLKEKKEVTSRTLAEQPNKDGAGKQTVPGWGRAYPYFNAKGEPRVLFDGKLLDAASGKVLGEFDAGQGILVSRDGKYLVRLTGKKDDKKWSVEVWSLDNET
jgi:hypothetical protein